jgi:diguanylate cyclase (GGDEF)-like protein/PAS domain S-box-containing protein
MLSSTGGPSLAFYRDLLENLYDGVYFVDTARRITFWNRGAARITGYTPDQILGLRCEETLLAHTDERGVRLCCGACPLIRSMACGKEVCKQVYVHHRDGRRIPIEVRVNVITGDDGLPIGAVELFRDNSAELARDAAYREAVQLAERDPLTGVANRRALTDHLTAMIGAFEASSEPFAVVMADLDDFKAINDEFGHAVGDRSLEAFAGCLSAACRSMDLVARFGGDEFVLVMPGVDLSGAWAVVSRLEKAVARLEGDGLPAVSASFGVAQVGPGDDWSQIYHRADLSLYEEKHRRSRRR